MRNWKTLSKKLIYGNPWIKIFEHKVIRPDGKEGVYGVTEKAPAVFVIAQDEDGSIFLLREYRYPVQKEIYNLPCGSLGKEDVITGAKRELLEETGITAINWKILGGAYLAPGFETTYENIVLATDLSTDNIKLTAQEGNESIRGVCKVSRNELQIMIKKNKIEDISTLGALCLYIEILDIKT